MYKKTTLFKPFCVEIRQTVSVIKSCKQTYRLVNPKDKLDTRKQSGTVYFIQCEGCPASYVGETERILGQRLSEHRRPCCTTSPVVLHAQSTHHTVDWNSIQILDKSDNILV